MLQLRPGCENCDTDLPPNSDQAMICSYECTFCHSCVQQVLHNVCPNCGGGFWPRPIRPATAWRQGVGLSNQPATQRRVHKPVNEGEHTAFCQTVQTVIPACR